jgi:hypothetical protein
MLLLDNATTSSDVLQVAQVSYTGKFFLHVWGDFTGGGSYVLHTGSRPDNLAPLRHELATFDTAGSALIDFLPRGVYFQMVVDGTVAGVSAELVTG